MARKDVVYHLGAHKTASSLLQKFMRDNPDVLRRHRLVYLPRGEMNECVGWGKRLLNRPEDLESRIGERLSGPRSRTLVTSHENTLGPPFKTGATHLYPRGPEIAARLATALRHWPSRVVLYIRPQDEFVESYYLQRIHQGHTLSFAEWLEELDLDRLSWRPVVDALVTHFGAERVEVVDFGLIHRGQNEFVADFFRRVDPGIRVEPDYKPVRNASISAKGLRIALTANKRLRSDRERKALRKFLQTHFSNRSYPRPVLFSEDQKRQLREAYAREYEELTGTSPLPAGAAEGEG
jgi:hypothetical protein